MSELGQHTAEHVWNVSFWKQPVTTWLLKYPSTGVKWAYFNKCVSTAVPSFCSDTPSEWSAPASEPSPELPWRVLQYRSERWDGVKHDFRHANSKVWAWILTDVLQPLRIKILPQKRMEAITAWLYTCGTRRTRVLQGGDLWTQSAGFNEGKSRRAAFSQGPNTHQTDWFKHECAKFVCDPLTKLLHLSGDHEPLVDQ